MEIPTLAERKEVLGTVFQADIKAAKDDIIVQIDGVEWRLRLRADQVEQINSSS